MTSIADCRCLLEQSLKFGTIGGIFNLATYNSDASLTSHSSSQFHKELLVKSIATKNLDQLSRELCPHLKYFVVFSSASSGRGRVNKSSDGLANAISERIIEHRVKDGFPGKAIQWGVIGEIGSESNDTEHVQIDIEIEGIVQQRIASCLASLDVLITTQAPIVASTVLAEKRVGSKQKTSAVQTVLNIFGIRDRKTVVLTNTLSDMGMDSLMMIEIQQALEREFEVTMSADELRALTLISLEEITQKK